MTRARFHVSGWVATVFSLFLTGLSAHAAVPGQEDLIDQLEIGGTGRVNDVIDGDTILLENGRQIRLVGIQAPKLPLGRKNVTAWPLAAEARQTLENLVLGRQVTYAFGGSQEDRHGRLLGHLFLDDGAWVQGEMLRAGLARVYSFADNRALAADMLALETAARDDRRGIWALAFYQVRDPIEAARHINGFELVAGRVLDAAVVRGRAYLNFGTNWRDDFTISLAPAVTKRFEDEGIDIIGTYRNKKVRVRGWLESFNGPMIEATHSEQIEILPEN
ncbi:MAG: thermonuclease family protein [Pseudomonadota bacterium]